MSTRALIQGKPLVASLNTDQSLEELCNYWWKSWKVSGYVWDCFVAELDFSPSFQNNSLKVYIFWKLDKQFPKIKYKRKLNETITESKFYR